MEMMRVLNSCCVFLEDLQPVSNPRLGDEISGSYRVWFDLSPQVADIDLQHVRFAFISRPPDRAQQLVVGEHLAGMFNKCA